MFQYNLYMAYIRIRPDVTFIYMILYDIYLVYIYRIYKSHFVTALIYMIQYDIYLVYIWRIYGPHLATAFIYIIQYNPYMAYIWIRPRFIPVYTIQYSLYLIYIWQKSASPRLKTDWFSFTSFFRIQHRNLRAPSPTWPAALADRRYRICWLPS